MHDSRLAWKGEIELADLFLTYKGVVYPHHCDQMDHMNVMYYVGKFDEATWQMFGKMGIDRYYMEQNQKGMAAVRQTITYRRELMAGDLISIWSGILELRERVIRFYHEMRNDVTSEVAATTIITGVHLDTKIRKAVPFPEEIREKGHGLLADYTPIT